jgi:phospholipid-binding lipoprotein MlaA
MVNATSVARPSTQPRSSTLNCRSTGFLQHAARPLASIMLAAVLSIGCATIQEPPRQATTANDIAEQGPIANRRTDEPSGAAIDRLPRINQAMYRFNRLLDRKILRPVARGYDRVIPVVVEKRVRSFFTNLQAPVDIVNNVLQGKFAPGLSDVGRFLLNSTAGLGGIFDPATKIGLERHPEDFGQTFAVWGAPSGSYLVLPILGPGTLRDWGGFSLDLQLNLLVQHDDASVRDKLLAWRFISNRVALLPDERTLEASFNEYIFVRESYLQYRGYEIKDGASADEDYLYLDLDE